MKRHVHSTQTVVNGCFLNLPQLAWWPLASVLNNDWGQERAGEGKRYQAGTKNLDFEHKQELKKLLYRNLFLVFIL